MFRLEKLRKDLRLTQIAVPRITGIDQSNYSKIERGLVAPTFDQCILLAKLFKTSMDYIAGLTDDPEPHTRSTKEIPPFLQD